MIGKPWADPLVDPGDEALRVGEQRLDLVGGLAAVGADEVVGADREAEQVDEHVVGDEHVAGVVLEQHRRAEVVDEGAHLRGRVGQPPLALPLLGHVVGADEQRGDLRQGGEVLADHVATGRLPSERRSRRSMPSRGPRVPSATSAQQARRGRRVVGVHDRQEAARQGRARGQPEQPLAGEERAVHAVGVHSTSALVECRTIAS